MDGVEIKKWREQAGLTQVQLAENLGVTSSTVARWERGEVTPPPYLNLTLRKVRHETPEEYIRRIMRDGDLNFQDIEKRAHKTGYQLGRATVQQIALGKTTNPGVLTLKALAAGLGRPEVEVLSVFGVGGADIVRDTELEAIQINYARLPDRQRAKVRFVIEMLSREIQRLLKEQD